MHGWLRRGGKVALLMVGGCLWEAESPPVDTVDTLDGLRVARIIDNRPSTDPTIHPDLLILADALREADFEVSVHRGAVNIRLSFDDVAKDLDRRGEETVGFVYFLGQTSKKMVAAGATTGLSPQEGPSSVGPGWTDLGRGLQGHGDAHVVVIDGSAAADSVLIAHDAPTRPGLLAQVPPSPDGASFARSLAEQIRLPGQDADAALRAAAAATPGAAVRGELHQFCFTCAEQPLAASPIDHPWVGRRVRVVRLLGVYQTINQTDCLIWPNDRIKRRAGPGTWRKSFGISPREEAEVLSVQRHCDGTRDVAILRAEDRYVAVTLDDEVELVP